MLPFEYCIFHEDVDISSIYIDGFKYRNNGNAFFNNGVLYFRYDFVCEKTENKMYGGQPEFVPARFLIKWHDLTIAWEAETNTIYIASVLHYDGYRKIPEEIMSSDTDYKRFLEGFYYVDAKIIKTDDRIEIIRYEGERPITIENPMNISLSESYYRICFQLKRRFNLSDGIGDSFRLYYGLLLEAIPYKRFSRIRKMEYSDGRDIDTFLEIGDKEWIHKVHYIHAEIHKDSEFFFALGRDYQFGEGVPVDYLESAKWYKKAVDMGHVDATLNLGVLYVCGLGVKQDYDVGIELYKKAIENGDFVAMGNLGKLYRDGKGVNKNIGAAVDLFTKASEYGYSDSTLMMAYLYKDNKLQDGPYHENENYWLRKAVEQGNDVAMMGLAMKYIKQTGIHPIWDRMLCNKAEKLFFDSSNIDGKGKVASLVNLSNHYFEDDVIEAELWALKAAETGDAAAEFVLACIYNDPNELFNDELAKYWFQKSAEKGYTQAINRLRVLEVLKGR